MKNNKITIICTECKNARDSWDLVNEGGEKNFAVCLGCLQKGMDPINFDELISFRKLNPGADRI